MVDVCNRCVSVSGCFIDARMGLAPSAVEQEAGPNHVCPACASANHLLVDGLRSCFQALLCVTQFQHSGPEEQVARVRASVDKHCAMLRLHVRLKRQGQNHEETILVPTQPAKQVESLKQQIQHRAGKLAGFEGCRVIHLRDGSMALMDDDDMMGDLVENGDTLLAEVVCAPIAEEIGRASGQPQDQEGSDDPQARLEAEAGLEAGDAMARTSGTIRYQTLVRVAQGLQPKSIAASG